MSQAMSPSHRSEDARQGLGRTGEELAVKALSEAGLSVVDRNWRCPVGEIDIIAHDRAPDYSIGGELAVWLVLVEVRTRRGTAYGTAREAVTVRKQAKLREVGAAYIQAVEWTGPWRIDVVAVQMDKGGRLQCVDHIRNAVQAT
jgi:putative endonuclease